MAVVCACLAGVLAVQMRLAQTAATRLAGAMLEDEAARSRAPIPDAAQVLRALKLVTVEIRTSVESASADESWRGDVSARVRAPVTYYYGVDLSRLDERCVRHDPITGELSVCVPRPVRLATEVLGGDEDASVRVTGTRMREVAGEYHLGLARTRLYERARRAPLSAEDQARLDEATRVQITALIRTLSGPPAHVEVRFAPAVDFAAAGGADGAGEKK